MIKGHAAVAGAMRVSGGIQLCAALRGHDDGSRRAFRSERYAVIPQLLDHESAEAFRRYILAEVAGGRFGFGDGQSRRWCRYRDPVAEELLESLTGQLSDFVGIDLRSTYSYTVMYPAGSELPRHRDREACEITVSLTLATLGPDGTDAIWPLVLEQAEGEAVEVGLGRGDAVAFRGQDLHHYRRPLAAGYRNYSVFLHYVDAVGPSRQYAGDSRA